ncbi:MAG: hypothetical protein LBV69_08860 [Bacteroidales bacterium]|jgi:class 3 adenylate cyclase/ligand-binding sensor domain-containing protein/predicted metal-dependent HD superfamily phosphohydrolase|nr:hypothetical protein [Bacteroidales bacterium]
MKHLISLIFSLFLYSICLSQTTGIPLFKNYKATDYKQESQNFGALKNSKTGIIYFCNSNGIMEFDNSNWNFIETTNIPQIVINSKNELFYCSNDEFGKISTDSLTITKLINFDKEIEKLIIIKDNIFLSTSDKLYKITKNKNNYEYQIILEDSSLYAIYKIHDKIICCSNSDKSREFKIFDENGKKSDNTNFFPQIINDTIIDIVEYYDDILIKTKNNIHFEILKRNGESVELFTNADKFVETNIYVCSCKLPNGDLLIGTKQGGLICVDRNNKFQYCLNQQFGLCNNFIHNITIDNDNNIAWICTNNGIASVTIDNSIALYNYNHGLIGNILSIYQYDNHIFVGTSIGLFRYSETITRRNFRRNVSDNNFDIKPIFIKYPEITTKCSAIININDKIYAITEDGFFLITREKAKKIISGRFKSIIKLSNHLNTYLLASDAGLIIAKITDKLKNYSIIDNSPKDIRSIAEEKNNNIWLGTDNNKLFLIENTIDINSKTKVQNKSELLDKKTKWIDVYSSQKGVLFSTNKGIFSLNKSQQNLIKDSSFQITNNQYIFPIVEDFNKNIWFVSNNINSDINNKMIQFLKYKKENFSLKDIEKLNQLNNYSVESIYVQNDSIIWIGTTDGLLKCSNYFSQNTNKKNHCFLRKIKLKNGEESYTYFINNTKDTAELSLNILKNSLIEFDFTSTLYSTTGISEYRYILENFNEKTSWSEWTTNTHKEYTNLDGKNYIFKIQSKDVFGNESNVFTCNLKLHKKAHILLRPYVLPFYPIILILLIFLIICSYDKKNKEEKLQLTTQVVEKTREISEQKEKIERIMAVWLPRKTVKEQGDYKNQYYDSATVIFSDIAGFSKIINNENSEQILNRLNEIFIGFDDIIGKYEITKIKTIGDAYMCVGGIEKEDNTHSIKAILASMEMQRFLEKENNKNNPKLEMRFGIHSGPLVSGVVGKNKLEYDIWGDTVNIANRMQACGEINKINVSTATYQFAKYFFDFEDRGMIDMKFIGEVQMYFVKNIKEKLSDDGITPNKNFTISMQYLIYKILEIKNITKLQEGLPANLYYHNSRHTTDVIYSVENIGKKENVTDEEMLLLKCAALFHDMGFLNCYDGHEEESAKTAARTLKNYNFSEEQIATVCRLILATKAPIHPTDLIEKILCDADLNYLIRPDFIPISENLFQEYFEHQKINSKENWYKMQYEFVKNHNFFTETAQKNNYLKEKLLKELESKI